MVYLLGPILKKGKGMQELDLTGHTALITGAAQGIGKETALLFLKQGANVLAVDINGPLLNRLEGDAQKTGVSASLAVFCADVSQVADLEQAAQKGEEAFGGVDILVNNAGILHSTPLEEITEAEWDRMMNVNLKSFFFAVQKVLPAMKRKKWGRIINMSSLAGRMGGYANGLGYTASKAGIIGLSRGLAYRLAKYQITVNCIAPGTTESPILDGFSAEKLMELKKMIPLGRLGRPVDIASLVLFLASEMSGFITGSTIDINGGMYMG